MSLIVNPSEENFPLVVPEPVAEVKSEEISEGKFLPAVTAGRQLEIGSQAKAVVGEMVSINVNSPEFIERIRDINNLGQKEIVTATNGPSRMLDRSTSLAATKGRKADATASVVGALSELRTTVEDLTPNAADLTGVNKILGFIPGGKKVRKYFQRYESAQTQLDNIIKSLMAGQDELRQDNASLQSEKVQLWKVMGELNEYAYLAAQLDAEVSSQIARSRAAGDLEAVNVLETDVLFAIRQRRTDILTQLAVSVQGYLAMGLVQKNNEELIKGVNRAKTTTITALRTAIILAKALTNQELVLNQLQAVNETTNNAILQSSEMLKRQTGLIHEQASNSGVSVETLTKAFDNVFATIDEIETFKVKANASMETTINGLSAQLERTRPVLDRAKALEAKSS